MRQTKKTSQYQVLSNNADIQITEEESTWISDGTVLVIDDDEMVREVAMMMLEDCGFSVLTAYDGLHGVEVFQQNSAIISLVLLDMTMPKMDGVSCFAALREIKADIPIILSSGYSEEDTASFFSDKSLAGFIQKPYSSSQFETAVRNIVENKPSTQWI